MTDQEQKEALIKEFAEVHLTKDEDFKTNPDYLFDWFYTKLKNQAEESDKRYNALKVAFDDMYKKADEYYESNKQLKAELSRKEEMLKAADFKYMCSECRAGYDCVTCGCPRCNNQLRNL